MNKYSIVFFDAASAKKTYNLTVTKLHAVLLSLFLFVLIGVLVFMLLSISRVKQKISDAETLFFEQGGNLQVTEPTAELLQEAITILQKDETFIHEIYETTPAINSFYSFDSITGEFTVASSFYNAFNLNRHSGSPNLLSMLRLTDMLTGELDARIIKYEQLEEYLEEQYVIYRHTPSIWPSPTERMTSSFGFRKSPFTGIPSYHEGTDMSARIGTPIRAAADGVVVFAGTRTGYGYLVTIDHGFGYLTRYAHNSKLIVKAGDRVKKGELISMSGATGRSAGPHLHYEVLYNGTPVDSRKFLPNEGLNP